MQAPLREKLRDEYFDLDPAELVEKVKKESFFHDMVLPGVRTSSWVYEGQLPPNYHLWPIFRYLKEIDLRGRDCVDIGAFDGMTTFVMAELGARRIDATCQFDLPRFRLARALRRYENVAYHPETSLKDISLTFESGSYDLAVISAMLHHLTAPLDALLEVRRVLKRDGIFLLESIFIDQDGPSLLLNSELADPVFGAPTMFVPTLSALRGMLHLAAFEIISETRLLGGGAARETNHERVTFLARARKPSKVEQRSPKAKEIHEKAPKFGGIDFSLLEQDDEEASDINYTGQAGPNTMNIWIDSVDVPLQPTSRLAPQGVRTSFIAGTENHFLGLASRMADAAFAWEDVYLLGARYPGETMPDGMSWGIKQLGNLHVLDYVKKLGLARVLEVGPGFNLYFVNHLPSWCSYVGLDAKGFYDANILGLANAARERASVETVDALLGKTDGILANETFDACISVSVLEHVPLDDISTVCDDMLRILRPGGWAVHSIDLAFDILKEGGARWLDALTNAGFRIERETIDAVLGGEAAPPKAGDQLMGEPLSIRTRFSEGYKKSIWGYPRFPAKRAAMGTVLVAAQKPRT